LVTATGSGPAIVAGDLNATPDAPQIEALARVWVDAYRAANPGDAGFTCCVDDLTSASQALEKRIDYVWVVPGVERGVQVVSSRVVLGGAVRVGDGWLWASDHAGVMAEIGIQE